MRKTPSIWPCAAAMVLLTIVLPGCVDNQRIQRDPIAAMLDRTQGAPTQIRAIEMASQTVGDDPRYYHALHDLLWNRGYAAEVRNFAVDELVRLDEADFREKVSRRINLIQNRETLSHIFDIAIARNWPDFTLVLVRNWARPDRFTPDADRPERKHIQQLNPGKDIELVVFEVFVNADAKATDRQQMAAWELLNRISTSEKLVGYFDTAPATTPLVVDLRAAAQNLHVLPANQEGVFWLKHLRDPQQKAYWDRAAAAVARLSPQQRSNLQLRHLAVILRLGDEVLSLSRDAMFARVKSALSGAEHHLKGPTYDGPMREWPQSLNEANDKLSWADLVAIDLFLQALKDRDMVAELFRQADKDLKDNSTEYGGVIDEEGGRFKAVGYSPLTRRHDYRFVPRQEMISHMYTALAHYHFHAHDQKNSMHAGPGLGDLRLVDSLCPSALVFTFIDANRLNVDYYQPGGAVVDLGTIYR